MSIFLAILLRVYDLKRSEELFFASFDSLIIRKIRSDAYLCRSSHFGVNDDNDNNNNDSDRRTKRLLYPLLRMRARGNYSCACVRVYGWAVTGTHSTPS